jgi:S-adenosylmethionine:tRNA ribosyltransferase-isomerase
MKTKSLMHPLLRQYEYELPTEYIAHAPAVPRDSSRLFVINRKQKRFSHHVFIDLPSLLDENSILVLNDTRVFPARLFGVNQQGKKVEVLLIKRLQDNVWEAVSTPRLRAADAVDFGSFIMKVTEYRIRTVLLKPNIPETVFMNVLEQRGTIPTPPYIYTSASRRTLKNQYQTIYAAETGSAAAPTAGLHFTNRLLRKILKKRIEIVTLTLHIGLGTFLPVQEEQLQTGKLHTEYFEITESEALKINAAKTAGKKIIAVGTTALRALESAADENGLLRPVSGNTSIFIYPEYRFRITDGLITNFHLPHSSLLMLICAFCSYPNTGEAFTDFGSSLIGRAYQEAIRKEYRFYSFGDACLIR